MSYHNSTRMADAIGICDDVTRFATNSSDFRTKICTVQHDGQYISCGFLRHHIQIVDTVPSLSTEIYRCIAGSRLLTSSAREQSHHNTDGAHLKR